MTPLLQVLLVTGGQHRQSQWKYLDSTEILTGSSWSYSASLPFPVYQFTAASLHSSVFVFGRSFVSVLSAFKIVKEVCENFHTFYLMLRMV